MRLLSCLLVCASACGGGAAATTGSTGGTTAGGTTAGGNVDPFVQHNLDALNSYRAQNGAAALTLDSDLNQFAGTGSQQLAAGGAAHGHFMAAISNQTIWTSGFCNGAGENQAPDWPVNGDENATIDGILKAMMDEGPGGGHHDNIVNKDFALLGVGLQVQNGGLYLTNDFSNACN